jgi:hypothetical protein
MKKFIPVRFDKISINDVVDFQSIDEFVAYIKEHYGTSWNEFLPLQVKTKGHYDFKIGWYIHDVMILDTCIGYLMGPFTKGEKAVIEIINRLACLTDIYGNEYHQFVPKLRQLLKDI